MAARPSCRTRMANENLNMDTSRSQVGRHSQLPVDRDFGLTGDEAGGGRDLVRRT
jgi:hypothetical protein